jgi:hypothetical protein
MLILKVFFNFYFDDVSYKIIGYTIPSKKQKKTNLTAGKLVATLHTYGTNNLPVVSPC